MSEIEKRPLQSEFNGKSIVCFHEDHSVADIVRYAIEESGGDPDDVIFLAEEEKRKMETAAKTAPRMVSMIVKHCLQCPYMRYETGAPLKCALLGKTFSEGVSKLFVDKDCPLPRAETEE